MPVAYRQRWARLLKQQTSITVYRLPTKENKLPFSVFVSSAFCIYRILYILKRQHTYNKQIYIYRELMYIHMYIYLYFYLYICCHFQRENGSQGNFPQSILPFAHRAYRSFVVCPSVYEETNGSYPFANDLNRLVHLCLQGNSLHLRSKSVQPQLI